MTGWVGSIEGTAGDNSFFRHVLFTAKNLQLVVMTLQPGEEIGVEMHDHLEQFIRVESGRAAVTMGPSRDEVTQKEDLEAGFAVVVPGGTWHNVVNMGEGELKLSTIYAPPQHPDGTIHRTRAEAVASEHD